MEFPHRTDISRRGILFGSAALALSPTRLLADDSSASVKLAGAGAREIPARRLPVPDTVSAAMQAVVGAPLPQGWDYIPANADQWRALARASGAGAAPILAELQRKLDVTVAPAVLGGVPVFISTPNGMPDANQKRVLMHLHGGGYVLFPGEVGAGEGMMMAGYGRFKVVSVDYRMAPDFPFPAALDDAIAVWKALLTQNDPARMGILGTSAGGGLTFATVVQARAEGLPLPAAIAPGSPWVDLAGRGDSVSANAFVDNSLVSMDGWVGAAAKLYAGTEDVSHPLISPIHADFSGMPPAILTSGTRDLLLSDTVRAHRKLRQSGVEAFLQVFEAQSHAQFLTPFAPETEQAFGEITRFFDQHLKR